MSRLGLDPTLINRARNAAAHVADDMDGFVAKRSTVAIERTALRLMGIDGVNEDDIPLPNLVVEAAQDANLLGDGISRVIARAVVATGRDPQVIAEAIADGDLRLDTLPDVDEATVREIGQDLAEEAAERIAQNVQLRNQRLADSQPRVEPLHYVIVATGNIYEDAVQAVTAARQWGRHHRCHQVYRSKSARLCSLWRHDGGFWRDVRHSSEFQDCPGSSR